MNRLLKSFSAGLLLLGLSSSGALAGGKAGEFDYYVLALSWSPSWCDREGDARNSPQCDPSEDFGFVVHGLWPQYEKGWPSDCRTSFRDPVRTAPRSPHLHDKGSWVSPVRLWCDPRLFGSIHRDPAHSL